MNIKRILIVVNIAVSKPVIYGQEINSQDEIIMAIESFFEEKGIEVDYTVVENIADAITEDKHFWYDECYCFQIANIYC